MKRTEQNFLNRAKGLRSFDSTTTLGTKTGTPAVFTDQFNLQFLTYYASVTAHARVLPAAVPAAIQNPLPVFAFGKMDYDGGYAKALSLIPNTSTWVLGGYGIYNVTIFPAAIDTSLQALLRTGDMIFSYTTTSGGVDYQRVMVVRCPQVSYGTLMSALNSDSFTLSLIRYTVDPVNLNQLNNQLVFVNQSLFGKAVDDKINPSTLIDGSTFNRNIADIALNSVITKQKGFVTLVEFDAVDFNWTMTCSYVTKVN